MASILLIEDDLMVSETIKDMLTSVAHSVTVARNGQQGIDRILAQAFDLIITDIIMPEREGIETIIALRKSHPSLPIIAISGGGRIGTGRDLLTMAERFGAVRTLLKPFSRKELAEAVNACLAPRTTPTSDKARPGSPHRRSRDGR